MKGKSKTQKGITLIALIITIVVLLILAVVAISSITNDGILQYAQNSGSKYNESVTNESGTLGEYENFLSNYSSGSTTDGESAKATIKFVMSGGTFADMQEGMGDANGVVCTWNGVEITDQEFEITTNGTLYLIEGGDGGHNYYHDMTESSITLKSGETLVINYTVDEDPPVVTDGWGGDLSVTLVEE